MSAPWVTLAATFVIFAIYRVASSSFSILVIPLQEEFAVARATVTAVFSAHMLVYSATSLFCGMTIDRIGPRATIMLGGGLLGLGMAAMSVATTMTELVLAFGVVCGSGVALVGLPANFLILSERFESRIATAMGIAGAGMGVGVLLLIPVMQWGSDHVGWRTAFLWSGVAAVAIVIVAAWVQQIYRSQALSTGDDTPHGSARSPTAFAKMFEIARTAKWQKFASANFLMGSALFGVLTHQVALLRESGWTAVAAATALGVVNVLRSGAGPLWGVTLDRYGRRFGFGLSTAIAIASLAVMAVGAPAWLPPDLPSLVFVIAFGIGSAGTLPTNASLGAELFTREQRATAWGIVETAYAGGAAFGAWLVGKLFDVWGDYSMALSLVGIQYLGAYVLVLWLSPPRASLSDRASIR